MAAITCEEDYNITIKDKDTNMGCPHFQLMLKQFRATCCRLCDNFSRWQFHMWRRFWWDCERNNADKITKMASFGFISANFILATTIVSLRTLLVYGFVLYNEAICLIVPITAKVCVICNTPWEADLICKLKYKVFSSIKLSPAHWTSPTCLLPVIRNFVSNAEQLVYQLVLVY